MTSLGLFPPHLEHRVKTYLLCVKASRRVYAAVKAGRRECVFQLRILRGGNVERVESMGVMESTDWDKHLSSASFQHVVDT